MALSISKKDRVYNNNTLGLCLILPFRKSYRHRAETKICPVCGKEFKVNVFLRIADPTHANFCSKRCRMRANDKTLSHLVSDTEFASFINKNKKALNIATARSFFEKDRAVSYEDVMQDAYVATFRLLALCKREKSEIDFKQSALTNILIKCLRKNKSELKREAHNEESFYDEEAGGLSNLVPINYDLDKLMDIRHILNEIYYLAKENRDVALAVEKALKYRIAQDRVVGAQLKEKYGLTNTQFFDRIKNGVEYIFYMMPKEIENYIDIPNTNETFRFHPKHKSTSRRKDVSNMTKEELKSYFATERQCAICGKWFEPTAAQKGKEKVFCSKSCSKFADRERSKAWSKAKAEKVKLNASSN